jgi:hypothetical protein
MDLLDKVLLEWSTRTEKGYPDLNNEQDLAIFESMFGFKLKDTAELSTSILENKEDSTTKIDAIIALINASANDDKLLERIYRTLITSSFIKDFKEKLKNSGLTDDLFDNRNLFSEIISILQKGEKSSIKDLVDFQKDSDIPSQGNIYRSVPNIPNSKLTKIGNLTGAKGSVTMGKGEILFPLVYSDVKIKTDGAGDLERKGKTVELKAVGVSKENKPSGGGRFGISRSFENYKPTSKDIKPGFLRAITLDITSSKEEDLPRVLENINNYINKVYPGNSVKVEISNLDSLSLILKTAAVESYIDQKKIEEFLLFNPISGDFKLVSPATNLLNLIKSNEVNLTTATSPQLVGFK